MGEHLTEQSQVEGDLGQEKLTEEKKAALAKKAKQSVEEEVLAMHLAAQDRKEYLKNEQAYRNEAEEVIRESDELPN